MYNSLLEDLKTGDTSALPEVHATSAGLKALTTTLTGEGIEIARKCCGGHGFSEFSGLISLYKNYVGVLTAEGENFLIAQQTTRYLLKCLQKVQQGVTLGGTVKYLNNYQQLLEQKCEVKSPSDFLDPNIQLQLFQYRCASMLARTAQGMFTDTSNGMNFEESWNNHQIEIYKIALAHCYIVLLNNFINAVNEAESVDLTLFRVLNMLKNLFALYYVEKDLGDFNEDGFMSVSQIQMLKLQVRELLTKLRPSVVHIVDSFNWSDYQLRSALGRYDGDAYNKLFEWAKKDPSNATSVPLGYQEAIKPLLDYGKQRYQQQAKSKL